MREPGRRGLVVLAGALLAACSFAPKYEQPANELPDAWGGAPAQASVSAPADRWWTVFGDPVVDRLVDEGLANNQDIAIAVARVDEARALVGVSESQLWPAIDGSAGGARSRASTKTSVFFPGIPVYRTDYIATLNVSYEIDLWGRLRNATAAARADLLATEAARDTVRITLASDVVQAYYALRSLDERITATERALDLRARALELQRKRADAGLVAELDVRQIEAEFQGARALLPALQRERDATEAALTVLLGRSPRAIIQDTTVARSADDPRQPALVAPAGLPSDLLLRRPDIFQAEQQLVAANARIGVARANFFPRISLTGFLGTEAASLSDLFTGPAGIWSFGGALAQPIFQGGRLVAETEAAEARQRQVVAIYQKTIQNAFREVRDALTAQVRTREVYEAEGARTIALREALKLAVARYEAGLESQLAAIDAERQLLQAELNYAEALRQQRAATADLFRALGGGWTMPEGSQPAVSQAEQSN
ncbi:MAG TPA: efflux transporter outer membrane subunit [Burkholderiales bacterium]|nr:efflux transporter outer membrane subunit [Burkholderiales bacterium]